jgi:hypothetical protein
MSDKNQISNPPKFFDRTGQNLLSNFEGIFSLKPMAKYLSGARCILRVNGKIVGFAFGISWNISTDATEITTIDDYLPYELAPNRITVAGTISGFRIPDSGPGQQHLQSNVATFLHQRYIEIEARDSQTDAIIFHTKRALVTNRRETINTGNLAEITLEFRAIGFRDEQIPKELKDSSLGPVDYNGTSTLDKLGKKAKDIFNRL